MRHVLKSFPSVWHTPQCSNSMDELKWWVDLNRFHRFVSVCVCVLIEIRLYSNLCPAGNNKTHVIWFLIAISTTKRQMDIIQCVFTVCLNGSSKPFNVRLVSTVCILQWKMRWSSQKPAENEQHLFHLIMVMAWPSHRVFFFHPFFFGWRTKCALSLCHRSERRKTQIIIICVQMKKIENSGEKWSMVTVC